MILSDNLLTAIPYEQISPLRALRILDISHNEINEIVPQTGPTIEVQLNLDTLHLDFNKIETIPSASFKLFQNINRTFLDGNPIHSIEVGKTGIIFYRINVSLDKFNKRETFFSRRMLFEVLELRNYIFVIVVLAP